MGTNALTDSATAAAPILSPILSFLLKTLAKLGLVAIATLNYPIKFSYSAKISSGETPGHGKTFTECYRLACQPKLIIARFPVRPIMIFVAPHP